MRPIKQPAARFLRTLALASYLASMAGCSDRPSANEPLASTSQIAATIPQDEEAESTSPATQSSVASSDPATASNNKTTKIPESHTVVSECGASKMTLECAKKSASCHASTLWIESGTQPRRAVAKPGGMEQYTPTGLACATSRESGHFFIVEYGELPTGCKFCEWFHLYDGSGKPLTASSPAIVRLHGRDPTQDQAPNNAEFTALSKELGLDAPEIQYLN